jgi:hypothetical protein
MTLPALDEYIAKGVKGQPYRVGPRCSNPNCGKIAEHAHHILRRSYLAGVYDWVEIDGWIVGNKTGLCVRCHDDVTGNVGGHKAAIRIDRANRVFQWCLVADHSGQIEYIFAGLLDPQPPTPESLPSGEWATGRPELEGCPLCGHKERARPAQPGPRRARKTWTVQVPADAEEDGAEVLDSLIENLAPLIPNADTSRTGRYYALVPVLAYATMDSERFVETMEGVGG